MTQTQQENTVQTMDSDSPKVWRKPQWRARNVRTHC